MASNLDMSLDDIINSHKKNPASGNFRGRARGRGRSSAPGPARRKPNWGFIRAVPYSAPPRAPETAWQHDMFVPEPPTIETGTKLYVSNLDYGVSNEDLKELFSVVGDVKGYGIHYDSSGRSKGTAEVVFSRRDDALSAVKRYNDVQLDGKRMKIEIVGTNITTPAIPVAVHGNFRNPIGLVSRGRGVPFTRGRGFGRGRGHGRSFPGRRGGQKISADDLDADLDKYISAPMHQT
ncbi:THO complex subunit 4A [Linum grandiflorum]